MNLVEVYKAPSYEANIKIGDKVLHRDKEMTIVDKHYCVFHTTCVNKNKCSVTLYETNVGRDLYCVLALKDLDNRKFIVKEV